MGTSNVRTSKEPRTASGVLLSWHLSLALEHACSAAEIAATIHHGTAYSGICRAAMALLALATDPHAAQDYDDQTTADEALRSILGSLLTGLPVARAENPESRAENIPAPLNPPQIAKQVEKELAPIHPLLSQCTFDAIAPEVPRDVS